MASAVTFTGLRRKRSPAAGAFFAPSDLGDLALIGALASTSRDLITSFSSPATAPHFQRRNARSLVLKVKILSSLFDFLKDSAFSSPLPSSATICLKELYILIFRSRMLLDYCSHCSKLWLLLQNPQISGNFHDLTQEIATILDVFPFKRFDLAADLREQLQLLHRQARRSKLYVDPRDESLRLRIFSFLAEFEQGRAPDQAELESVFFDRLGIRNAQTCRSEIDFLEEQIFIGEEGSGDPLVLGGVVALTRYCRFLLFGFVEDGESGKRLKNRASFSGIGDVSITIPKDFCCPISLDVMRDPVIVSTGQTYDRASIVQWMEEGHNTCPNSGQNLTHTRLVPNRALRSLISQWCAANGIHCDPPEAYDTSAENMAAASSSRAAIEANRATAKLLVGKLDGESESEITVAARELRLLAKTGKENRICIAEAGAIPLLRKLLSSSNPAVQENSVTAILNLSIHDKNKTRIIEEEGCLRAIIDILRHGRTTEARENAAATLFSLSAVHDYKKRITDEPGSVQALSGLLRHGSQRGKKDAVTALFNLSTHPECCVSMMDSGAIWALVKALSMEEVAEEAAGALALLVRQQIVADVVGRDDVAVGSLVTLMRRGSPKAKENAVAALHELCKSGGLALTQRVAKTPALSGLIQTLLFTGTKRARRKAASLARMCQRSEMAAAPRAGTGDGQGVQYSITRSGSGSVRRGSTFVGGDVSVSVAVSVL